MKNPLLLALSVIFLSLPAQAADSPEIAAIKAAGATIGPLKEGGVRVDFRNAADIKEETWPLILAIKDLKYFSASGEQFTDAQLLRLSTIPSIERLFFNGPGITEAGLATLAKFPNLHHFGVHHSKLAGTGLSALADARQLTSLEFGGCMFNDEGMIAIASLTHLTDLRLGHDRETGAGFPAFAKLTNLKTLAINPNFYPYFTGHDFVHLANLQNLRELSIAEMLIPYENGLSHLKNLKLTRLKLERCQITPADLEKLKADLPATAIDFTPAPEGTQKKWEDHLARQAAEAEKKRAKLQAK